MSYMSTIRLLEKLGENHDAKVFEWKKSLLAHLETTQVRVHVNTIRSESTVIRVCPD